MINFLNGANDSSKHMYHMYLPSSCVVSKNKVLLFVWLVELAEHKVSTEDFKMTVCACGDNYQITKFE